MGASLHLVEPLGFELDDKKLRRAGLDYHEFAGVTIHNNWQHFREFSQQIGSNVYGVSTKGGTRYSDTVFREGDFIVFGPETRGLPGEIREEIGFEKVLRIPMREESRSLNLSNAVALVAYEAWRQQGFAGGR